MQSVDQALPAACFARATDVVERDDSERSYFVTSFSSLQLLLGCS
jgi:hypothetical protein